MLILESKGRRGSCADGGVLRHVRTAVTIVLLAIAVALVFTSGGEEPAVPPGRGPAEAWDEATEWAILSPRKQKAMAAKGHGFCHPNLKHGADGRREA